MKSDLLVLALLVQGGCGYEADGSGGDEPQFMRYDSAGVEIVVSRMAAWGNGAQLRIDQLRMEEVPLLTISTDELHPGFILYSIGDLVRLSDGRLVVENRGLSELLVFGPGAEYIESWGGEGDGPGEFRFLDGLFSCGRDSLLVVDRPRLKLLDGTGKVLRTSLLPAAVTPLAAVHVHAVRDDCSAVMLTVQHRKLASFPSARAPGSTWSYPRTALWASLVSERIDTLGTFPGEELMLFNGQPARFPFSSTPSWAGDGRMTWFGVGDEAEFETLDPSGSPVRVVRWLQIGSPTIGPDEWQAYEAERSAYLSWDPDMEPFVPPREVHPHPEVVPVFSGEGNQSFYVSGLLVDDEGRTWVRRYQRRSLFSGISGRAPPQPELSWWILDRDGRWLGELRTPEGLLVKRIEDGLVLGVVRDQFDSEEVHIYRLVG